MIKPQNVVPVLKDKKIRTFWDLSAGLAVAGGGGVAFCDPDNTYEVISVKVIPTVTLSGTTTNLKVGTNADDDHFVTSVDVVATAGNRVVGVANSLTLVTGQRLLTAGQVLELVSTGTADTGEAIVVTTLRPVEKSRGNASKRPGASAQASA